MRRDPTDAAAGAASLREPVERVAEPVAEPVAERLAGLLARVALADRGAFEALYRATSAQLFGVVLRIAREPAQAEEVLQDIYVKVWRSAGEYDARQGSAMTWLTSIARHRAIDSLRRRAARPATVSRFDELHRGGSDGGDGDEPDLLDLMPSEAPGPAELLQRSSEAHALTHCMEALNGRQRSCLALAYYQGLSYAEVAGHLRQPLGTVKSLVRRALASLRGCLDRAIGRGGEGGEAGDAEEACAVVVQADAVDDAAKGAHGAHGAHGARGPKLAKVVGLTGGRA